MSVTLGTNIASLRARSMLQRNSAIKQRAYEQLSSGQRINRASDDAAGLALSEALKRDARLASVAKSNASQGISLLNITDDSLSAIQDVLFRISELAEQAATGTFTNRQRSIMELEVLALGSEIQRIATVAEYNDIKLLSASQSLTLQVGYDGGSHSRMIVGAVTGTLESLNLAASGSNELQHTVLGDTTSEAQLNAQTLLQAAKEAIDQVSSRRGEIGASTNRLESVVSQLASHRENFSDSLSKIMDANVAEQAAQLVRSQVLEQANVAILAQANIQPRRALELLR